jgi:hypothetical protein
MRLNQFSRRTNSLESETPPELPGAQEIKIEESLTGAIEEWKEDQENRSVLSNASFKPYKIQPQRSLVERRTQLQTIDEVCLQPGEGSQLGMAGRKELPPIARPPQAPHRRWTRLASDKGRREVGPLSAGPHFQK